MPGMFQVVFASTCPVCIHTPCKGKSFKYKKLLPLQGDFLAYV